MRNSSSKTVIIRSIGYIHMKLDNATIIHSYIII